MYTRESGNYDPMINFYYLGLTLFYQNVGDLRLEFL